ncbi:hypothetical protein U1Q18_018772 [Sarracenia purpurea var. burkii]
MHADCMEDKSSSVKVVNGGVNMDVRRGKPGGATIVNVEDKCIRVKIGTPRKPTYDGLSPGPVAEKIPLLSTKLPEIPNDISVGKGEEKCCAATLELMIDFNTLKLGKCVHAIFIGAEKEIQLQKYSIAGPKKMAGNKTKVMMVKAMAICHRVKSEWNPKHLAIPHRVSYHLGSQLNLWKKKNQ